MNFSEEQIESLSKKVEERERRARRMAWVVTIIPILFAGLLLAYTIWQISNKQVELNQIEAQVPQAQSTLAAALSDQAAVEATKARIQMELSTAQADLSTAQAALTQAEIQVATKQEAGRVLAQGQCTIDEMILKEYSSNYTPQAQMLLFLFDRQWAGIPWNPTGFSEAEGFDSPNFALYALMQQGLIPSSVKPGTLPWQILPKASSPANGDIVYYQSGYTMFYYELPSSYGGQATKICVIGMTPLGIMSLPVDFAQQLGYLQVPYNR